MYALVPTLKPGCIASSNVSATLLNVWSKGGTDRAIITRLTGVTKAALIAALIDMSRFVYGVCTSLLLSRYFNC